MKRLTIHQIAKANIRINKKAYISLFLGILTAVFLATATSLCAWGTIRGHEEQMAERVGWMDMFLLGSDGPSDERLRDTGFFREIGHVTVNATVEDSSICAGYYDETAARLLDRRMAEGRMPGKAGEIAAERSALIRLGMENARVGETLKLKMQPVHGVSEEKSFLLTGILNEQTDYLETYMSEGEGMRFPALLVSPEETNNVGGAVVHRVMTYAPLMTLNQVIRHAPEKLGQGELGLAFGVSRENGRVTYYDSGWERAANLLSRILIWAVLGAALMLSACVAITSAMESLLGRKTEDIGMLRAIGATRRQIRRIYGAEAWLLTVTALPSGMVLGIAATWIISCIAPDQMAFSLNVWLLIPILGLSALCVFVASRFPLYNASRQMPMGVLRDTALLRRAGLLLNHRTFRPATLIARRRAQLHPLRQLGCAGMIALTLLSTLMLGELVLGMRLADMEDLHAYRLNSPDAESQYDSFSQNIPEDTLSRAELYRLTEIEGVSRVGSVTQITANLLMDEIPEYFRTVHLSHPDPNGERIFFSSGALYGTFGDWTDWMFYTDEDLADARSRAREDWYAQQNVMCYDQMNAIRSQLGIAEKTVPVSFIVADLDGKALKEFVTDGAIDTDRLDSGEQVLVYAPTIGVKREKDTYYSDLFLVPGEFRENDWDMVISNDAFTAGMPLNLLELAGERTEPDSPDAGQDRMDWGKYYRSMETVRAGTTVGAVLSGPVRIMDTYMFSFAVITTVKGAQALGLKLPNPEYTNVYLSGDPSPEAEERITSRINQIALRGWMNVENQLQITREYKARKLRQILLFTALILLFFAVSVFMQVSGTARQIRSETRTIGTLRAVGADLKMLVGCYSLPVWICAAGALAMSLALYSATGLPALRLFTANHPAIMIPVLIVLTACIALACIAGIRSRLAAVSRQTIVENIREL